MVKYLPSLEVFVWFAMTCHTGRESVPFGSLAGLKQLKHLALDYNLFAAFSPASLYDQSWELPSKFYLETFFPPGIEGFGLYCIGWDLLCEVYNRCLDADDDTPKMLDSISRFIVSLPVKRIVLEISMCNWPHNRNSHGPFVLNEPAVDALRVIADTLDGLGTNLMVQYHLSVMDHSRFLVKPKYTAEEIYYDNYLDMLKDTSTSANRIKLSSGASTV